MAFTADILFKDAVGGGPDATPIRASVMDTLMTLPAEVRVLPGHTDETTIGREWEENPFVRYWRGEARSIDEAVRIGGEAATLVVWSPDYDGKGKALVRLRTGARRSSAARGSSDELPRRGAGGGVRRAATAPDACSRSSPPRRRRRWRRRRC